MMATISRYILARSSDSCSIWALNSLISPRVTARVMVFLPFSRYTRMGSPLAKASIKFQLFLYSKPIVDISAY